MAFRIIGLFILTFCVVSLKAQNSRVDSLLLLLDGSSDEEKINLFFQISDASYYTSYNDFILYAQKAKVLALKHKMPRKIMIANNYIAIGYNQMGQYDTALYYYDQVLEYVIDEKDSVKITKTLRNIGIAEHSQGRLDKARNYYEQSMDLALEIHDTILVMSSLISLVAYHTDKGEYVPAIEKALEALGYAEKSGVLPAQSDILVNLGNIYGKMGDYEKSLEYQLASLAIDEETGDLRGVSYSLNNIGLIYKNLGKIDSAVHYFDRSLRIKRKLNDRYGIVTALINLGNIYRNQGNNEKAIATYDEGLLIADSSGMLLEKVALLQSKARSLADKNKFEKAEGLFLESLEIAQKENAQEDIRDIYEGMALMYKKKGDMGKAYDFLMRYTAVKDSILNESSQRTIAEMQTRFETEKKEKEIEILTQNGEIQTLRLKKQESQLWLLSGGILIVILITFLAFTFYRLRQKNYRTELEKKNLETEQRLLRTQMNPHFIFNSMNSIQSYISENDNFTAMSYLSKFAQLMRFILENSRKSMIPLEDEINTLNLYMELEKIRFKQAFEYKLNIDKGILPVTTFVPPMLVQPVVENAIKHGLRNKKGHGFLELDFFRKNGVITCTVKDNGIGREKAQELKAEQPNKHRSLGMQVTIERLETLKKGTAQEIGMEIVDLKDKNGVAEGTLVKINIPYEEE